MVNEMKNLFLDNPEKLEELLSRFGYANFKEHNTYYSFGRDEDSSPKAIMISKEENENLRVHDFARNKTADIISFIMQEKGLEFKDVISEMKDVLNVTYLDLGRKKSNAAFNGIYKRIKPKRKDLVDAEPIPADTLDQYSDKPNARFLKDGISIRAQHYFHIGYSFKDQAITIPIFREDGELIGVKARINRDPGEKEQKYFYLYPCNMSKTLFGYSQNYMDLENAENLFIFEAEKSVMQAFSFDVKSCVAMGSSSLSRKQSKMIGSLAPKNVILMMDEGVERSVIDSNCQNLIKYNPMKDFHIWVWEPGADVPHKASATDLGYDRFIEAVDKELVEWKPS